MTLAMVFGVMGIAAADDWDLANIPDQGEFQVMTLGNYKYGEDYTSLYEKYGKTITIADVEEDEETGFGYITVDGEKYELGLDFLTMAMVYNTTPAGDYETERADQGRSGISHQPLLGSRPCADRLVL